MTCHKPSTCGRAEGLVRGAASVLALTAVLATAREIFFHLPPAEAVVLKYEPLIGLWQWTRVILAHHHALDSGELAERIKHTHHLLLVGLS